MTVSKASRITTAVLLLLLASNPICNGLSVSVAEDYLPREITDDHGQKAKLSEWKTDVHLLFCQGSHAQVYFRTPPVLTRVHLIDLDVRLRILTDTGNRYLGKQFLLPAPSKLVDNVTGFARVDLYGVEFACRHNCWGYVAEVRAMTFNDTYSCLDCMTSTTARHCVYYPNGTVSSTKRGVNCTDHVSRYLREQYPNCTATTYEYPDPRTILAVAISLGFIILLLAVSCAIYLLYAIVKARIRPPEIRTYCINDEMGSHIRWAYARLLNSQADAV